MSILEGVRNFFVGRPDTGITLDPEALSQAAEATQLVKSVRHNLERSNDNDRFLRGVMDGLHR